MSVACHNTKTSRDLIMQLMGDESNIHNRHNPYLLFVLDDVGAFAKYVFGMDQLRGAFLLYPQDLMELCLLPTAELRLNYVETLRLERSNNGGTHANNIPSYD